MKSIKYVWIFMLFAFFAFAGCGADKSGSALSEWQENDMRNFMFKQLNDVRHLLGNEVSSYYARDYMIGCYHRGYLFAPGVTILTFETGQQFQIDGRWNFVVTSIEIQYIGVRFNLYNQQLFHIDGINGASTRSEVISAFGSEPLSIRTGSDEYSRGASVSYGYFVCENQFARFFFNERDEVVAINIFLAERPYEPE